MSQEVVDHARDMTRLHAEYGEMIISLAKESTQGGGPINRCLVLKILLSMYWVYIHSMVNTLHPGPSGGLTPMTRSLLVLMTSSCWVTRCWRPP